MEDSDVEVIMENDNESISSCDSEINIKATNILKYDGLSRRERIILNQRPLDPNKLRWLSAIALKRFLYVNNQQIPYKISCWSLISSVINLISSKGGESLRFLPINNNHPISPISTGCRENPCRCIVNEFTIGNYSRIPLSFQLNTEFRHVLTFSAKEMRKYLRENLYSLHRIKDNCRLSLATQIRWLLEDDNETKGMI